MHHAVPDPVIDAFMALLAEKAFEAITLPEIAARAGIGLADLREAADGKLAILAAFQRRIDRAVLSDIQPGEGGGDSGRDRLFDIAMRRFDKLVPHKRAMAHLSKSAARDPALVLALNALMLPSARYMLAAAGISTDGLRGLARMEGFALVLARVAPVFIDDADPDQARTMAALDKALARAEGWDHRADRMERAFCHLARRIRPRRARKPAPSEPAPDTAGEAAA